MGFLGTFFLRLTAKGGYILYKSQLKGKRRNLSLGLHKGKQKFILGFPYKGGHLANWLGHRQPQTCSLRAKGLCFQCWWKPFYLWTEGNCHISSSGIPRDFPALSCFCAPTETKRHNQQTHWRRVSSVTSLETQLLCCVPQSTPWNRGWEGFGDTDRHSIGTAEAWLTICSPPWSCIMTIKTLKD